MAVHSAKEAECTPGCPVADEIRFSSNLYGLLAAVTRGEMDAAMLTAFRNPAVAEALQSVGVDLTGALADEEDGQLLEQLATSYAYLFLLTLSPHGSVQRGEGGLWGDSTVAAQGFLEENGIAMAGERALLPDHIATQLAVMQYLTAREANALEMGDMVKATDFREAQKRYMREHLGVWGDQFFSSAERLANHEFYRQIARLGCRFLQSEKGALAL